MITAIAPTYDTANAPNLPRQGRNSSCADETVDLPIAIVDTILRDLHTIGLVLAALRAGAANIGMSDWIDNASDQLDRTIRQLQGAVFGRSCDHPNGTDPRNLDLITADLRRSVVRAVDFAARGTTLDPCTIELLDAAHSAQRALLALSGPLQ